MSVGLVDVLFLFFTPLFVISIFRKYLNPDQVAAGYYLTLCIQLILMSQMNKLLCYPQNSCELDLLLILPVVLTLLVMLLYLIYRLIFRSRGLLTLAFSFLLAASILYAPSFVTWPAELTRQAVGFIKTSGSPERLYYTKIRLNSVSGVRIGITGYQEGIELKRVEGSWQIVARGTIWDFDGSRTPTGHSSGTIDPQRLQVHRLLLCLKFAETKPCRPYL